MPLHQINFVFSYMGYGWSKLEAKITFRDACPIPFPFLAVNQNDVSEEVWI